MYTFDHDLFLALNFDGGKVMDTMMEIVSGTLMWIPLYIFILLWALRKYGWRSALAYLVCLVLAIGLADMLCGIFKHTGLLKDVWESFPVRHRPMFDSAVRDLAHVPSYAHGPYGTVSAHAATVVALAWVSGLMIRHKWYDWFIAVVVLLICYSRIYLACHFPMDILLGSIVGTITGVGMYYLWRKLDTLIADHSRC
ncbi:MAG: phosphatase PAP2 family protein [Rikenellaceae bacterium]|nr:phosphatase PAP2 family protein [Rikenellaceae bacterium]